MPNQKSKISGVQYTLIRERDAKYSIFLNSRVSSFSVCDFVIKNRKLVCYFRTTKVNSSPVSTGCEIALVG
jgi:hypothetical protein